jgi:hypothetical protein
MSSDLEVASSPRPVFCAGFSYYFTGGRPTGADDNRLLVRATRLKAICSTRRNHFLRHVGQLRSA